LIICVSTSRWSGFSVRRSATIICSLLEVSLAALYHLHLEWSLERSFFEFTFDDAVFNASIKCNGLSFILNDNICTVALDHSGNGGVIGAREVEDTARFDCKGEGCRLSGFT